MFSRVLLAALFAIAMLIAGCGEEKKDSSSSSSRSARGTGYTLQRPPDWRDGTKESRRGGVFNFDLVLIKPKRPFNTNVNILRSQAPEVGLDDLRKGYRGELDSIGATGVTAAKPVRLDGDEGITYEYLKKTPSGDQVRGRQVLIVHDGFVHSITLTAVEEEFVSADAEFDSILTSWRWS